jgi:PleD family two-component response regulator
MNRQSAEAAARPMFSRRWVVPSVCIVDAKQHVRAFLGTALEEFGFIVCECPKAEDLAEILDARPPDLVLIRLIRWRDRDNRHDQDARNKAI